MYFVSKGYRDFLYSSADHLVPWFCYTEAEAFSVDPKYFDNHFIVVNISAHDYIELERNRDGSS